MGHFAGWPPDVAYPCRLAALPLAPTSLANAGPPVAADGSTQGETEARAYARPKTIPRMMNAKNTLCAEWTIMPSHVLRKRQLGKATNKTPLITFATMPHGW